MSWMPRPEGQASRTRGGRFLRRPIFRAQGVTGKETGVFSMA